MRNIVAIGSNTLPNLDSSFCIYKEIIQLAGVDKPRILFIPTGYHDNPSCCEAFKSFYETHFNCEVQTLLLLNNYITDEEISSKLNQADIIFAGGTNALKMMRRWRFLKVDKLLRKAMHKGTVLAGIGAGAICWFHFGFVPNISVNNHDLIDEATNEQYIRVKSLGFVDRIMLTTAYNRETVKTGFAHLIRKVGGIGLALEEGCAIMIKDDQYKIIGETGHDHVHAYKLYKSRTDIHIRHLGEQNQWQDLYRLLSKV